MKFIQNMPVKMKKLYFMTIVGFLSGVSGAYVYHQFLATEPSEKTEFISSRKETIDTPQFVNTTSPDRLVEMSDDFVLASMSSTSSVVYIRNISERTSSLSFYDLFFGERERVSQTVSTGSGVIFSKDGYIVTNNHVIEDADRIEIIHNKKTYDALLVGTDPSTDLAVLKVHDDNLPAIKIGSSTDLQVGAWVLAVGNPFNLTSTVTAGIVSAKGRNINILKGKFPIESFIQTDAAINPGNSGGALVNKEGELVGINTAILSRTGSYAGYGFAIPVDIVIKVVRDIMEFGEVQKAFFGGDVADLDEDIVNRLGINSGANLKGVVLNYLQADGSAAKADLREGDIILKINNEEVNSKSAFDEIISYYSPGDQITVTYQHKGRVMNSTLILTIREGTTGIIKTEIFTSKSLGADLEVVPKVERDLLEIDNGVRINKVYRGLINELGIREGFIITSINNYPIKNPKDLVNVLEKVKGRVRIEGVSKEGKRGYYSFYLR